jgi:hypothetical protein
VALAVRTLPVAMIEPAFRTPLVTAVGSTTLQALGFRAASRAAIALSAIAVRTDPEHRLTPLAAANPLPKNHFAMNRHPPTQPDFDHGNCSRQGRTSFDGGLLMLPSQNPAARTAGFSHGFQATIQVFAEMFGC